MDEHTAPPLPTAPPASRGLSRRWKMAFAALGLAGVLGGAGFLVHLPYYALGPGPAEDVGKLVHVSGRTYPSKGAFLLTTVSVSTETVTVWDAVGALFDGDVRLVGRGEIIPPGVTDQEQDILNRHDMEQSKYVATVVALRAAGLAVPRIAGARVVDLAPGTPAAAQLRQADVIVGVDGKAVDGLEKTVVALRGRKVGDSVRIEVLRGELRQTFSMKTVGAPGEPSVPVIGVALAEAFRLPREVTIDSLGIVGPSGGLVFALAIADSLTPGDLTGGHRVAATGTISLDGSIGPIGGVGEKIVAAEQADADVFLVPADELAEAKRVAGGIEVFGVATIADAVRVLSALTPSRAA